VGDGRWGSGDETYNAPTLNIATTYTFFFVFIDSLSSSGIGTLIMAMSRAMLMAACAQAKMEKLMHFPVCWPSQLVQIYDTGKQLKSVTMVEVKPYAADIARRA
jgi:hypothetical protein